MVCVAAEHVHRRPRPRSTGRSRRACSRPAARASFTRFTSAADLVLVGEHRPQRPGAPALDAQHDVARAVLRRPAVLGQAPQQVGVHRRLDAARGVQADELRDRLKQRLAGVFRGSVTCARRPAYTARVHIGRGWPILELHALQAPLVPHPRSPPCAGGDRAHRHRLPRQRHERRPARAALHPVGRANPGGRDGAPRRGRIPRCAGRPPLRPRPDLRARLLGRPAGLARPAVAVARLDAHPADQGRRHDGHGAGGRGHRERDALRALRPGARTARG